jgi:Domain of unknown function (DUF1963)
MITVAEIERLATEEGVEQPAAIAVLARPGYRLVPTDRRAEIGASKLGGAPDLPPGAEWPIFQWGEQPLPMLFLGQIALEELVGADWFAQAGGLLSFFYGAHPTRGLADSMRAAHVLHTPRGVEVRPAAVANPLGAQPTLNELAVEPRPVLTLPDDDLPVIKALGLDWDLAGDDRAVRHRMYERFMAYMRVRERVADAQYPRQNREPQHQFLGWPSSEQDSALISFAMTEAEEEDWYGRIAGDDELDHAIVARAMRWQLLLQIDHDDRLKTDFGDGGGLYIGAPAADAARGELSRVDGTTQSG